VASGGGVDIYAVQEFFSTEKMDGFYAHTQAVLVCLILPETKNYFTSFSPAVYVIQYSPDISNSNSGFSQ